MSTLLLRLAAPLQAWGTASKFEIRRTGREPTKSGIVGLLAAALGRQRDADLSDLCALRFGIRIDKEGELLQDFHMAKKDNSKTGSYLTRRYYLCDAVFLAGLESSDENFLEELDEALRHPAYALFLGRRSCPPSQPLSLGIREKDLRSTLMEEPLLTAEPKQGSRQQPGVSLRMILDASGQEKNTLVMDLPLSFDSRHREYEYRPVTEENIEISVHDRSTEHDPMKELSG